MTLTRSQRKQLAEIVGNIASAWFAAGIISPLFSRPSVLETVLYLLLGLLMTAFFTYVSLVLVEKVRI